MVGRLAFILAIGAGTLIVTAQNTMPENDDYESFEVEPPPLLPNRTADSDKSTGDSNRSLRDPVELEKKVERAKRTAADAELLFKKGVLSRMEVELRALRIVRLQADLEMARAQRAEAELAVQKTRLEMGEISKDQLAAAERDLRTAKATAEAAAAARERAEIGAAEANLRRQRKLANLGSARASDVARAEQKLADLKAAKN